MRHFPWAGLALSLPVLASASTGDTSVLDTLVVTGQRLEVQALRLADAITVINRADIEASQAVSLAELLRSRGGIEVQDSYGDGSRVSFSLRGFGENAHSNVLILLNGQPLNNPDIANPDLGRIRLEEIERVEILDGGSALWGNQAVGGVIHIVTRQHSQLQASFVRGDFGLVDVNAQARLGDKAWSIGVSAARRDSDNYRDNNALERKNGALEAAINGSLASGWVRFDFADEFLETPGGLYADEMAADRRQSAADFAGDFSELTTRHLSGGLKAALGPRWQFDARAAQYDVDGTFKLSFRGFPSDPAHQDRTVRTINPQWTWRYSLFDQEGQVSFGADFSRADYELKSQFGLQRNHQEQDDYYLTTLLPVHKSVDLSLSYRRSQIDDELTDDFTFPDGQTFRHEEDLGSAGLSWRINPRLTASLGWDQLLRYPKVDEYFGSGFTPDTVGLEPQTGDNFDLSLRWQQPRFSAALVGYVLKLDNEIVYDPASFMNTNLPRTERKGVNATVHWSPSANWGLDASIQHINAKLANGNDIPLVASEHGQAGITYSSPQQWRLRLQAQATGSRAAGGDTDASAETLPGHATVDVIGGYRIGTVDLSLKVLNALDREYTEQAYEDFSGRVSYLPLPGRQLQFQLRYEFR